MFNTRLHKLTHPKRFFKVSAPASRGSAKQGKEKGDHQHSERQGVEQRKVTVSEQEGNDVGARIKASFFQKHRCSILKAEVRISNRPTDYGIFTSLSVSCELSRRTFGCVRITSQYQDFPHNTLRSGRKWSRTCGVLLLIYPRHLLPCLPHCLYLIYPAL